MRPSVARTAIGPIVISTIELTSLEAPDKYETMIFYGETDELNDYQTRCSTEAEAFAQHIEAVQFYIKSDLWV
jgi:hypothetical protein